MKSKNRYWWGVSGLLLAGILTWALLPEYGKGYSENQRRNWNGIIALSYMDDWEARVVLLKQMEELVMKDAPEWNLDIPESFGDLPLEGRHIPFLKKLAEEGSGDASLELAFRAEYNNMDNAYPYFAFSLIESVYLLETYLPMAMKQGRVGAEFLWRLFEYRKKGGDDEGVKKLEGYHSFLARMDAGDFALGKVYLYLDPNGKEALSRLADGLRKKADCGDVVALRDAAYLALLRCYRCDPDNLASVIYHESRVKWAWIVSSIEDFYGSIPQWMTNSSSLLGKSKKAMVVWLEEFERDRALRRLEAPLELLGEAAEMGDIHAKYLWVKYSETIKRYFSKDDWEFHLKYVGELIKEGGIYSEVFCEGNDFSFSKNDPLPEWSFYKYDCCSRIIRDSNDRLKREYTAIFPNTVSFEMLRMNVIAATQVLEFTGDLYSDEFFGNKKKYKNQQAAIQLLEQAAEQGDPHAIFQLSKILSDYGEREGDALRAWGLLEELKRWVGNVRGFVRNDNVWYSEIIENGSESWGIPIGDSIEVQKINIVSRHGDMPGMTTKEAFEQFWADSSKGRYMGKQGDIVKEQFKKRGFKAPEDKK